MVHFQRGRLAVLPIFADRFHALVRRLRSSWGRVRIRREPARVVDARDRIVLQVLFNVDEVAGVLVVPPAADALPRVQDLHHPVAPGSAFPPAEPQQLTRGYLSGILAIELGLFVAYLWGEALANCMRRMLLVVGLVAAVVWGVALQEDLGQRFLEGYLGSDR